MSAKVRVLIKWGLTAILAVYMICSGFTDDHLVLASILLAIGGVWGIAYIINAIKCAFTATESAASFVIMFFYIIIAPIMGVYHAVIDTIAAFIG